MSEDSDDYSDYSSLSETDSCSGEEKESVDFDNMNAREMKEHLDKLLARFFFGCSISFVTVQSPFFLEFIKAVNKAKCNYEPPCAKMLAEVMLTQTRLELKKKKRRYLNNTDSVLICDGWKNPNSNRHLFVFTLSTIHSYQTFLHAIDISTQREFAENLAENINKAIKKAKKTYNSNVYAVVTDNDSKMLCGVRRAVPIEIDHDLWQSSCSSHSANLLCTHFESKDDPLFFKYIKSLNVAFKHPQLQALLIAAGGKVLKVCPDTRWLYMKDSIVRILDNLAIMRDIARRDDVILEQGLKMRLFSNEFQEELENWIDILTPISKFVKKCESFCFNVADSTQYWCELKSKLPNAAYDTVIEDRIKKAVWECGYAANLLHHKHQGILLDREQKEAGTQFLMNNLNAAGLLEYESFDFNSERFKIFTDKCISPIAFWNLVSPIVPNLSKIAIKLMLIPASTAQIEGLFSQWKFVHSSPRNRLGFKRSCDLIDVYYSLRHETHRTT